MSLTDVLSAASKRWSGPRDEAIWNPFLHCCNFLISRQGILDPFTYIASHPGNGVRERLLSAFNLWMDVPQAEMEIIGKVVGMLHNASLMCAVSIHLDAIW
jgi:hypothetical protein